MKAATAVTACLFALLSSVSSAPIPDSPKATDAPASQADKPAPLEPWQVYSLREQPFDNAKLRFSFLDPVSKHETDCETVLPMNGYTICSDDKTSFIYGGLSYQYGETWLSIQRIDVDDCSPSTASSGATTECKKRVAAGTLNLPNNFWQQPGWNSWVHPEAMDVTWGWVS